MLRPSFALVPGAPQGDAPAGVAYNASLAELQPSVLLADERKHSSGFEAHAASWSSDGEPLRLDDVPAGEWLCTRIPLGQIP